MTAASWSGRSPRLSPPRASSQVPRPTPAAWCTSTRRAGSPPSMCSARCSPTPRAGLKPPRSPLTAPTGWPFNRSGLVPMPGASEALQQIRGSGIRVCFITGLSRGLLGLVLDTLGWWRQVDLVLCPEDAPRGYPWPDPMLCAMLGLGVTDVRETAYAGGTESGILCGRRAGAQIVAGILTGGHTRDRLQRAGATHLLGSFAELPGVLAAAAEPVIDPAAVPAAVPAAGAGAGAGRAGSAAEGGTGSGAKAADPGRGSPGSAGSGSAGSGSAGSGPGSRSGSASGVRPGSVPPATASPASPP